VRDLTPPKGISKAGKIVRLCKRTVSLNRSLRQFSLAKTENPRRWTTVVS
jgi:hypothetical protein